MRLISVPSVQIRATNRTNRQPARPIHLFTSHIGVATGTVLDTAIAQGSRPLIAIPSPELPPTEISYSSSTYFHTTQGPEPVAYLPVIRYRPPTTIAELHQTLSLILSVCVDYLQPAVVIGPLCEHLKNGTAEEAAREVAACAEQFAGYFHRLTVVIPPSLTSIPTEWIYDRSLSQQVLRYTGERSVYDMYRTILTPSARL